MDNIITIRADAPEHLVLSWLGVLVGMGYRYKIDPESPMFRAMNENKLRIQDELVAARASTNKPPFNQDGVRIIHRAGDSDSITVSVRPDWTIPYQ